MKDERIMILKMLEEGKISSDEASNLIEALDDLESEKESIFKKKLMEEASISEDTSKDKTNEKSQRSFEEKMEKFGQKMENFGEKIEQKFGDDFSKKMEEKGEKIGEKMSRLGEDIADGATTLADKIVDMFDNMMDNGALVNIFGTSEKFEETLEKDLTGLSNLHLEFEGTNGKISINPWSKEKILIKTTCHVKKGRFDGKSAIYQMIQDDNRISFKPGFTDGLATKLEINIPDREYNRLTLRTSNGKIEGYDIKSDTIDCQTSNASITLSDIKTKTLNTTTKNAKIILNDIKSEQIKGATSNASINLEDIASKEIYIVTKNGKVLTSDVKADILDITTSNASINLEDTTSTTIKCLSSNGPIKSYDLAKDKIKYLDLKTSNSSIDIKFDKPEGQFDFDLRTSMGHINLDIPNLVFDKNDQKQLGTKQILAHTVDYSEDTGIKIMAKTSNGSIKIG